MKKTFSIFLICTLVSAFQLFAENFRINKVIYNISGSTTEQALERNVPVSKNRIFESQEDFESYIEKIRQDIINTRCFETSDISYEISDIEEEVNLCSVTISVKDSFHFLALPYFKYSSANGLSAKIKAKDTNFLGSMNDFNTSIDFMFKPDEDGNPFKIFEPELNFAFDFPFRAANIDFTWINDYSISYTWGEKSPDFDLETGLLAELPIYNEHTLNLKFVQSFIKDFDYRDTGDELYFNELFSVYSPFTLCEIQDLDNLKVTPNLSLSYNWDPFFKNGESGIKSAELQGPSLTFSTELTLGRVNWNGNLRNGLTAIFTPEIGYNFASIFRDDIKPYSLSYSAKLQAYKDLKYLGLNTQFTTFGFVNNTKFGGNKNIDTLIRGVIDSRYSLYGVNPEQQGKTPFAMVVNFDMPVHILTTDWENFFMTKNWSFMRHFNFELQLCPFVDIALITTDKDIHGTNRILNPKDGFYGAGFEVLVFPAKWSSYVVRASVGVDMGRQFLGNYISNDWRNTNCKKYEISIGLGTFY